MSCYEKEYKPRAYDFYYQVGSLSEPDAGFSRGFDEDWEAMQYMDEDREHCQQAANESGEPVLSRVIEEDSGRVVQEELIYPERASYVRDNRLKLGDLLTSVAKQVRKATGKTKERA